MIRHEHGFAEEGLPGAVGDGGEKVAFGVGDQFLHRLVVGSELLDRFVPIRGLGRSVGGGPVIVGPVGGNVLGVGTEFENIGLGDSHMLDEPPGSVGLAGRFGAAQFRWEVGHRFVESEMGAAAFEEFDQLSAKGLGGVFHGRYGSQP